ncbi:phage terminase large subunit family protein [Tepidibacillus marianensis]|uniref:phage terminase large subunit family protein n=1 Tax=Tepidibacillus marianensis TaxID=3131995 RepID=UPI0030D3A279
MTRATKREIERLNAAISGAVKNFAPPKSLTVAEWADRNRHLSPENSAEAGPWRTSRTPYLKEPMEAFNDPKVHKIVMVAASQVGKSELELNIIGYIIDQDPGSILFVQPTLEDARKFSRLRIAPMIRDSKPLKAKVSDVKTRDSGNTILQKSFPGGMLTITGSNSASALASTPARYILGDERDRWAISAGTEGDPWSLAEARQATFYNAKAIEVSTPTIKGSSNIEASFYLGTQERWCHQCPECGEWHNIVFDNIKFDHKVVKVHNRKTYKVTSVNWACPSCGCLSSEEVMRKQPARWIADNPAAYENGIRSFWLNAFSSPWMPWEKIVRRFLEAKHDPEKLKVVYNTLLGELWEDRGDIEDEDTMLARREEYDAELPDGVLVLTCGVDTQDNRLEYEVVGHGHYGETWGIKKGYIIGKPDTPEVWQRLDDVIDHVYKFKNGRGLKISITCVDSGGHYTQEVYKACRERQAKRVFAIKGKGGDGIPYVSPPTKVPIKDNKRIYCWLYTIGVDSGKESIMSSIKVQEKGAKYCHFPRGEDRGYDSNYFNGLLSERLVLSHTKIGSKWTWEKLPGHTRNEALDCRNYAMAGLKIIDPDMDAVERRLKGLTEPQKPKPMQQPRPLHKKRDIYDDW